MSDTAISNTAIIILAAGKSARMSGPKQLLLYKGKSLLSHAVDAALETGCRNVFVVLGSNRELLKKELAGKKLFIIENGGWEEGMASSIRCGLEFVKNSPLLPDCVIFMVCDQPYAGASLLMDLLEKRRETGKPIVACRYENIIGIPALFHKSFFPVLMELKGDQGARKLIAHNLDKVAELPFAGGIKDIDTKEDYAVLIKEMES
jgi:molybdenum cofactor cytidylyltransferase